MKMELDNPPLRSPAFHSVTLGVCCCALAAISYTAANACLKQSMVEKIDPVWITCIKESTAFVFAAVWMAFRFFRRLPIFPNWKEIGILVAIGLAVQLLANLGSLWAIGKIGLSVTIPTNNGMQLLATAMFGWLILGERVSFQSMMALGLLLVALVLLGFGAEAAGQLSTSGDSPSLSTTIALAVGASCLSGVIYSSLSIALRRCTKVAVEQCFLMFVVAGMGAVTMWPLSFYRVGIEGLVNTSSSSLRWMLGASFFNVIGFLGIAKGLQLTSVVHASVLNASQVAMCAVVGMTFFHEPNNSWLIFGVIVTLIGIMLVDRPTNAAETVEVTV